MLIDYKKLTEVIIKENITVSQLWFLVGMTFDRVTMFQYIDHVLNYDGMGFTVEEIDLLEDKGLIINTNPRPVPGGTADYNSDNIFVTDKAKALLGLVDSSNMAETVYDLYPYEYRGEDGKVFPTKGISLEAFEVIYNKIVKGNKELHETIVAAIEYATKHNLIYIGRRLDRFIEEKQWVPIVKMLEEGDTNSTETWA